MAPGETGTLFVCATPIGNLEDITLRALRVLREVDLIAAEDTRHTRKLLAHYDIHTPTTSYHQHSRGGRAKQLVEQLQKGRTIALVADAGTPGISDPGHELVSLAIAVGVPVVVVPGPSAVMSALAISGLPVRSFRYEGFLPRRQADRRALLASLAAETRTVVMFEAPHRLCETLEDILEVCGDRPLAAARELTKVHEEVVRGTVSEVLAHFRRRRPRGEFTLVLGGAQAAQQPAAGEQELERALRALLEEGVSLRDAARRLATVYGVSRRQVYQTAVRLGLADE